MATMMAQNLECDLSDWFDCDSCGTHIRNTAEIGPVVIGKIENKGRQNRRINIAFAR